MISPDKRSFKIAEAFTKFIESKDKSLIEDFTRAEIEIALLQLIKNGAYPYYEAMQIRRDVLKQKENHKKGVSKKKVTMGKVYFQFSGVADKYLSDKPVQANSHWESDSNRD